jgi:pyrroloquinoline quinone biosynthesis protein B
LGFARNSLALLVTIAMLGCVASDPGESPVEKPTHPGQLRLRVLGTAQDGGFPHAACSCSRCELARRDPSRERLVASLALIDADNRAFLFDATPDIRRQLERLRDIKPSTGRVERAPVDGVFLTHAHLGHYTGLGFFGFEAVHTSELPLYATPRMIDYLSTNGPWSQLLDLGNLKPLPMVPSEPVRLGDEIEVTAFHVPHRDEFADTVGFLIAGPAVRVAYIPDTDGWDAWDTPFEEWLDRHDIDVALLDGTFFSMDELPGRDVSSIGHPRVADTIERLRERVASGRLRVYFTHFNHSNPLLDADGKRRREVEAAGFGVLDDGFELPLQ